MTEENDDIEILLAGTDKLIAYSRKLREIIGKDIKRYDGKKLYLVYILDFAIGTADSIQLLSRNRKTRDSYALARILFESWVNAEFLYTTDNFTWSDVLIAYNDVETLDAIRINVEYAGEQTEEETERIRVGKEYLAEVYSGRNQVPIVGSIQEERRNILAYNAASDTYAAGQHAKGCANFSLFGRCKLIDETILQDLERGQKATTHYKTAYRWYSQFVHSNLLGLHDYRGGMSQDEPITERDIKIEQKLVFYYLCSILKLAQDKLPIIRQDKVERKFAKELSVIEQGNIEKEII